MEDSPAQGKKRGSYQQWTARETKFLVKLLTDGIKNGWRDASGCINKMTVEKKILPVLNFELKCEKNYSHYQSKMRNLKNHYNNMQELTKFSSGFGWDPTTKKFTAPDHVWDDYEKAHPSRKNMRDETFEDYEDLQLIFDIGLATGRNDVGLGDDTDAQTFGAEDNTSSDPFARVFGNIESIDGSQASGQREKLLPRKIYKSGELGESSNLNMDSSSLQKSFTEMIDVSSRVVDLIQQREERQQREIIFREAEKRKNNVWEAIKEISGLEENIRYATLEEIYRLGMKEVFINMSIEERLGWILRKK